MPRIFLLLLYLCLCGVVVGQERKMPVTGEPSWVSPTRINYHDKSLDAETESGFIHLSVEKQVSLAEQAFFFRERLRILSEDGASACKEIKINFMPAYQQVVFHMLRVIRNGKLVDKIAESNFRVVRDESELHEFLYNGTENVIVYIEDLREDDVLEYSYSIRGFNPVLSSKYAGFFELRFDFPVYHTFYKLVVPKGREVTVKNYLSQTKPVIENTTADTRYVWHEQNALPVTRDESTPGWYDPVPAIMVSEYRNWNAVSKWALPLYNFKIPLDLPLLRKVQEIVNSHSDNESRILSALQFVQDDIRYFGIEVGENSHKPRSPNQTFAQRFGDCKDKAYLLCVMLRKMGISADPVLINTTYKKAITEWLPSSVAFDHVVAKVMLGSEIFYLDATIPNQRGRLKDIHFPDFQYGLVINEQTQGLTALTSRGKSMLEVKETFHVKDMKGLARLVVRTEYRGQAADHARNDFHTNSPQEVLESFREYYAEDFEEITGDSIRYYDNEKTGVITSFEYYTIKDFWLNQEGDRRKFSPYIIKASVSKPENRERHMPYSLKYPLVNSEEIEINLPEDWAPGEKKGNISCAGFRFDYDYKISGRKVSLKYKYHHLKDHVLPSEMEEYDQAYSSMMEEFGYNVPAKGETALVKSAAEIQHVSQPVEKKNPFGPYGYLYGLLFIAVVVTLLVRRKRTM